MNVSGLKRDSVTRVTNPQNTLDLKQIAELTGYANPRSAYRRLWVAGVEPAGYEARGARACAVYRMKDVVRVLGHRIKTEHRA